MTDPRVDELTEGAVLRSILSRLAPSRALVGPGDDAAVIAADDGRVVVTVDTLVDGPDFRLDWSSAYDLGWKSAAVNLSDIAAMGARPTALFVALAMPGSTRLSFVEGLADGLRAACEALAPGCAVEGGDLTASDTLTIAVTALGALDGRAPALRSGARPRDVVAVCGELGAAGRGLQVLFDRFDGRALDLDALTDAERHDVAAQLRPEPPVNRGLVAAQAGVTAMMDVSDGLVMDATRMADASDVTIDLDPTLDHAALQGGEDHALLATFPPEATLPDGFRIIGTARARGEAPVLVGGEPYTGRTGWDPYTDYAG